jgi:hypothetical protein
MPGHVGVRGNKQADRLAVESHRVMDWADTLNANKEARQVNDSSDDYESAILTRLQVKHMSFTCSCKIFFIVQNN